MPVHGLETPFRDGTVLDIARKVVALSHEGLVNRAQGEEVFLRQLEIIVERGYNPAKELLMLYENEWNQSVDPIYKTMAY